MKDPLYNRSAPAGGKTAAPAGPPTFDVLGVRVSAVDLDAAVGSLFEWVKRRRKGYVCVAPVSTIVACRRDENYRRVVNEAAMVTPDGMPLVWWARAVGLNDVGRTYGPDLMQRVLDQGRAIGLKHFLYGGHPHVLVKLEMALKRRFPGVSIAGRWAPPFRPLSLKEEHDVIRLINESGCDIVWVGLGSPKQDYWMHAMRPHLQAPVLVGVGAAFDFLAGAKPQAPRWMQRGGLEWVFRWVCEPRRLTKRYVVGNSLFVWWTLHRMLAGFWSRWLRRRGRKKNGWRQSS